MRIDTVVLFAVAVAAPLTAVAREEVHGAHQAHHAQVADQVIAEQSMALAINTAGRAMARSRRAI